MSPYVNTLALIAPTPSRLEVVFAQPLYLPNCDPFLPKPPIALDDCIDDFSTLHAAFRCQRWLGGAV